MGVGEKLKDIYYLGEEKWYSFWDSVDSHIPVYKIIDPIDNFVPTFALFLIIIFILLLLLSGGLFNMFVSTQSTLRLSVVENDGTAISGATVSIQGIETPLVTNDFGVVEPVIVQFNSTVEVTVQKDDRKKIIPIFVDDLVKTTQITLSASIHLLSQKSIRFATETGETATGEMTLLYSCSTGATPPQSETIYNGTANVSYTDDCGTLSVEVSSPKYESKSVSLISPANTFTLVSKTPKEIVKVIVNLKLNGTLISESVAVQAFNSGNSYIPTETKSSSSGQVTFDLPEGDYTFKVRQEQGYKQKISELVSLSKTTGQKTIDIAMEKNFIGSIKVTAKEGSLVLNDVYVTISKKLDSGALSEINNKDTNSSGQTVFDLAESSSFVITGTKDGYCDASSPAVIGDSIILSMQRENSQCGNKLMVRVLDQDGKPVAYSKVAIFGTKGEDEYKLPYLERVTDYNGYAEWGTVRNSTAGETYKVFGFKSTYSGWSSEREFSASSSAEMFIVRLDVPMGAVKVTVKDNDNKPVQFAEVQLFDEYIPAIAFSTPVSGKKIIENADGTILFNVKADKRVYAIITKSDSSGNREYESFTTLPVQVIGEGTINFDVVLSKPPVEEIKVNFLGLYKNSSKVLKLEPGQEYDALFEITAPKDYEELGFFALVGKDNITKTELDKLYIKEVIAPAKKTIVTGSTYTKPKGYATDEKYLNLEESKWAQVNWEQGSYVPGKIITGVKIKIKSTAQAEERLDIGYRVWGVLNGAYERDLFDNEIGTAQNSNAKQELYASLKWAYVSVGTETLCESPTVEKSFCI
ncbi:MAG: hypothetical protein WC652_01235, partial [archaeon]